MFDLIPKLLKSPIFFSIALLIAIMLPSVIYKTGESERLATSVIVGLNYQEDNPKEERLELSLMFLTPQSNSSLDKNYAMVTTKGKNVSECLDTLELKIGKEIGLSHCQVIVLSESLAKHGAMEYLDSFTRTNDLTTNALLICSKDPKKLIEAQISESATISITLTNILNYITENIFTEKMNLEKFYADYFDESGVCYIPFINAKENKNNDSENNSSGSSASTGGGGGDSNEESNNMSSSNDQSASGGGNSSTDSTRSISGSSGGGNSTSDETISSQGPAKIEIAFDNTIGVFQRGKLVSTLNKEESTIFNILYSPKGKSSIQINNTATEYTTDSDMTITIEDKNERISYNFVNGYPVIKINLTLFCKLAEINSNEYTLDSVSVVNTQITEVLHKQILEQLESKLSSIINFAKENNIDMFYAAKYFHRLCTKEWAEYKLNLDADDNYMRDIIFILDTKLVEWT